MKDYPNPIHIEDSRTYIQQNWIFSRKIFNIASKGASFHGPECYTHFAFSRDKIMNLKVQETDFLLLKDDIISSS